MPNNNEAHFTKIWANKTFFTIYSEPSFCSLVYEGLQMEVSSLQNVSFFAEQDLNRHGNAKPGFKSVISVFVAVSAKSITIPHRPMLAYDWVLGLGWKG